MEIESERMWIVRVGPPSLNRPNWRTEGIELSQNIVDGVVAPSHPLRSAGPIVTMSSRGCTSPGADSMVPTTRSTRAGSRAPHGLSSCCKGLQWFPTHENGVHEREIVSAGHIGGKGPECRQEQRRRSRYTVDQVRVSSRCALGGALEEGLEVGGVKES